MTGHTTHESQMALIINQLNSTANWELRLKQTKEGEALNQPVVECWILSAPVTLYEPRTNPTTKSHTMTIGNSQSQQPSAQQNQWQSATTGTLSPIGVGATCNSHLPFSICWVCLALAAILNGLDFVCWAGADVRSAVTCCEFRSNLSTGSDIVYCWYPHTHLSSSSAATMKQSYLQ